MYTLGNIKARGGCWYKFPFSVQSVSLSFSHTVQKPQYAFQSYHSLYYAKRSLNIVFNSFLSSKLIVVVIVTSFYIILVQIYSHLCQYLCSPFLSFQVQFSSFEVHLLVFLSLRICFCENVLTFPFSLMIVESHIEFQVDSYFISAFL